MITIQEVTSKTDFKKFVTFPFLLYKNSKYWVPPIIKQEMDTFNKNVNPVFNDADARFFLAYKNDRLVGRIAAITNWIEVKKQAVKKMRFGWFDFIDDQEVSKALLDTVKSIGLDQKLEFMEGPVGFSNLDKVGVVTEGFNHISNMITWYNHEYYVAHYRAYGLVPEKHYVEYKFPFKNVLPEFFKKAQELIKKRYKLTALNFTKTSEVLEYADAMFDLFNQSYASLSSFVEITDIQKDFFKKKFIPFVNPEYIKFVIDQDNKLIGFAVVMPSFSEALQQMKGKLFPLGFLKLLKAKKNSKDTIFYLIGIHPDYQNKGIHAVIFNEYYETFKQKGINYCYRTPELEDNIAIQKIWKHFKPEVFRRRKTFRKNLS